LRYLALWYQLGTVGYLILTSLVIAVIISIGRCLRLKGEKVAFLIPLGGAFICALIAEAANPYLSSLGTLWMVYLPIGALNTAL